MDESVGMPFETRMNITDMSSQKEIMASQEKSDIKLMKAAKMC